MRSREWPADGETLPATDETALAARYVELMQHHHDLDYMICALSQQAACDELLVARLKKRKLRLKDEITRFAVVLDPTGDTTAHP
jgi:hypothetical protein